MSQIPPDQNHKRPGGRRPASSTRRWITACAVLAIVACFCYVVWELSGPIRISSVHAYQKFGADGTVVGFNIVASGKGPLPPYTDPRVDSVVLVDSESDPHFRITATLWDRQEHELKVVYVLDPGDPAVTKLPDRRTQIEKQLARTRRDGRVEVTFEYQTTSWLSRKLNGDDPASNRTAVRSVPVSVVKE